jgi:hypothetical protein
MGNAVMVLGALLLAAGLGALACSGVSYGRMRRIAVAPIVRTGYVGKAPPDGAGKVAAEGRVLADNTIRAPCSGQTCLAYEIALDRAWEKESTGLPGGKKQTGTTRVSIARGGALFQIDDGSGPALVDAREEVAADFAPSHLERQPMGAMVPSEIRFGQMRVQTPADLGTERTVAFIATERILLPQEELYVRGALVNGAIGSPVGEPLVLSRSGHVAQVAAARRRTTALFAVGAVLAAVAVPVFLAR